MKRLLSLWYNYIMVKLKKDGKPDKRTKEYKKMNDQVLEKPHIKQEKSPFIYEDNQEGFGSVEEPAQTLFNRLLIENSLHIDFDVIPAGKTVVTEYGLLKLEKDQLVIKASYVTNE